MTVNVEFKLEFMYL